MRSFAPMIEAYDLALNPRPPMAIPAVPITLFLMNSLLFMDSLLFVILLASRNQLLTVRKFDFHRQDGLYRLSGY